MKTYKKSTGSFRSFDETTIYYETRGEGAPIVLVYGIACLMNHWQHQIHHFSHTRQVVTLDLRGHHRSGVPVGYKNLSLEAIGQDLIELLDHLDIRTASFWGHSFGVQAILSAFALAPERINSCVFINGFAKNPVSDMFGVGLVEKLYRFVRARYEQSPEFWTKLWRLTVLNPLAVNVSALAGGFNLDRTQLKDVEIYARGVANMDLQVFMDLFDSMMTFDGEALLSKVEVPTLIISGEKDSVTPRRYQRFMRRKIPNSEFMLVPYGSHCTQLDFPEYVDLRIEKFLKDNEL